MDLDIRKTGNGCKKKISRTNVMFPVAFFFKFVMAYDMALVFGPLPVATKKPQSKNYIKIQEKKFRFVYGICQNNTL